MTAHRTAPSHVEPTTAALLSFARCCGALDGGSVYVSAPITTGRAYLSWVGRQVAASRGVQRENPSYRTDVVLPNIAAAAEVVARTRREFPQPVLDPSALEDVPGWEQEDYHRLWVQVIEIFADTVVFVDGWEYSTGCALEFAAGVRSGARLLTQEFLPLSAEAGLSLISNAVRDYQLAGLHGDAFRAAALAAQQQVGSGQAGIA